MRVFVVVSVLCMIDVNYSAVSYVFIIFFFNDTATTEIYTRSLVGSVRCV